MQCPVRPPQPPDYAALAKIRKRLSGHVLYGLREPGWRSILSLAAFAFSMDLQAAPSADEAAPAGPVLQVDEKQADLGPVPFNEPFSHTFKIRNAGGMPLRVEVGHKSCSCTTSLVSAATVVPGEAFDFQLGYTPKFGSRRTGLRSVSATLETNDPNQPQIAFKVAADRVFPVASDVTTLSFGKQDLIKERGKSVTLVLRPFGGRSTEIRAVESSTPAITISEVSRESADDHVTLNYEVSVTKNSPPENSPHWIRFVTNSHLQPRLEIPVEFAWEYDITTSLINDTAIVGVLAPGAKKTVEVALMANEHADLDALQIAPSGKELTAKANWNATGESRLLHVTLTAPVSIGKYDGRVDLLDKAGRVRGRILIRALVRDVNR